MITCLRLPHFAAHLESCAHPELQGQVMVLVDKVQHPPQVYGVSAEAARAGIRPGMPLTQAQGRCDNLRIHPATPGRYREAFESLLEALTVVTPQVEAEEGVELRADARQRTPTSFLQLAQFDDFPTPTGYLDLGKLKPDAAQVMAQQIDRLVRDQVGLPPKLGMASGKFTARVAATAVNAGELALVPSGEEAAFLAEFTAALLPVDGETLRQLDLLGLYTLGQVAGLPISALLDRFGKQGRTMHRLANGHDTRPVGTYQPPIIARALRRWDNALADWARLDVLLRDMVSEAAARLFDQNQTVRHLTLRLTQEDGAVLERETVLRQPSANLRHIHESASTMGRALPVSGGIVEAELVLSDIAPAVPKQLSLFERDAVPQEQLSAVLHDLVARYGDAYFYWMCAADLEARLPERRFRWEQAGPEQ